MIAAAVGFAIVHTAAGLWQEQRAPGRLHWAALPAAVPVLTLAVAYGRIEDLQPAVIWAMTALALATALTGTATLAVRAAADG